MPDISSQVIDALRKVLPDTDVSYSLNEPFFNGNEWEYTKECLDTAWVSTAGKYVDEFERQIAEYTGSNFAIAVVNGTAALHVALQLAGIKHGDEVLVPALTFVATSNAVAYCGATPHFVDSEERTLGIDPLALREYLQASTEIKNKHCVNKKTGCVIRALIPMHTFGHPVDIEGIKSVAKDYHLTLIEDAAESLGSRFNGSHTGTFGLMGVLSFNGNKIITTGGGGAIITNDKEMATRVRHLTTTAKLPHRWEFNHDEIGYNYRMPNINAALGCAQLELLPLYLKAKRKLFDKYKAAFDSLPQVHLVSEPSNCISNYWLQTLLLDESIEEQRDSILDATNNAGLMTRPAWTLTNKLPPYKESPKMNLPIAESLERRIINLPSSVQLGG